MAAAGIGSRRECELIIQEGRVEVDGQIVVTLGVKVDPQQQKIFVDGERLAMERLEYYMLNKPPGVVSTSRDPSGRARVIDLIKTDQRVYNVGRLDQSSEGLILVTNDGQLANQLTHPRFGIEKKYHVQVDGVPTTAQLRSLEEGIFIAEGKAKATSAKLLKKTGLTSWLEIVLSEGRNREIRRLLAKIGHRVRVLKRVAIGPLKLADLPSGAHRRLTIQEVKLLKQAAAGLGTSNTKKESGSKGAASGKKRKLNSKQPFPNTKSPGRNPPKGGSSAASAGVAPKRKSNRQESIPGKPIPGKPIPGKSVQGKSVQGKSLQTSRVKQLDDLSSNHSRPKSSRSPQIKQKQIRSKRRINPKGRSR